MPDPKPETKAAQFRCLRCFSEFTLLYTPGVIEERACPTCTSNSVRRLPAAKSPERADAPPAQDF